jgi:hypothetical protein
MVYVCHPRTALTSGTRHSRRQGLSTLHYNIHAPLLEDLSCYNLVTNSLQWRTGDYLPTIPPAISTDVAFNKLLIINVLYRKQAMEPGLMRGSGGVGGDEWALKSA